MTESSLLPFIRVKGTNHDIGKQIGEHFQKRITQAFEECKEVNDLIEFDRKHPERLDKVESLAIKHFPRYMDEIKGISEGSGLDYRQILVANFRHVPFKDDILESCSTIIFKNDAKIILTHNEDYESVMGKYSYLTAVELNNGTSFFAHSYPGCISGNSFGFNSHGIVFTANSLPNPVKRIGLSRILFGRCLLEAKTMEEAIESTQLYSPRSGGASYNIVSLQENKTVNLETTADDSCLTEITDKYFHTNHYISEKFKNIPYPKYGNSKTRYRRGIKLLSNLEKIASNALEVLSDKYIIFNSVKDPDSGYMYSTICTAQFEISNTINLRLYPPHSKKNEFMSISLSDLKK
jgi:predicted choloylglycine hydrolase